MLLTTRLGCVCACPGACLPYGVGVWGEFPGPFSVELSSLLVRNVNYEIPSLKKQIAKCQQQQQEYSRKEEEGQAGAAEMREQFYHSCKQYGITVSGTGLAAVGGCLGPLPVFPGPAPLLVGKASFPAWLWPSWASFSPISSPLTCRTPLPTTSLQL